MLKWLFLLFLIVPLVEIYILIQVGSVIGALPTILMVVLTAILGAALLRQQGLSTLARLQHQLNAGELPAVTLLEGVVLLMAGGLLLTPGFFTDALGFAALVPGLRRHVIRRMLRHYTLAAVHRYGPRPPGGGPSSPHRPDVIEGEFKRDE